MAVSQIVTTTLQFVASNPYLVIVGLLLQVVVYFIYQFLYGGNKGANPLQNDTRRPPEPFVHDTKTRDAVIKDRFKPAKVPENLDVIIVGSGAGALSAGVLLSRAGKKVLILEQHDQAGGCCHSFIEKGFEFDTGIHYVGDIHEGSPSRVLLDQLTGGQLRWSKLDDAFDTVAIGEISKAKRYPMKSGPGYYQNLIDQFPQEKAAILKYRDLIKDASSSFISMLLLKILPRFLVSVLLKTGLYNLVLKCYRKGYATKTLQEVLDGLTDNTELHVVLSYICGDYGVFPKDAPFLLHAGLIQHYEHGAFYPVNGTSEIAYQMIKEIHKGGGKVLVEAPVSQILCDSNGTAVGVRVGKNELDIHAKYIISDAGVVNTFKTLLPENVAKSSSIYPLIEKVGQSYSFLSVFIGVEGSSSELKLPAGNVWWYNGPDINKSMDAYMNLRADEIDTAEIGCSFISFPSAKDPEFEKSFQTSVLAITLANWDWFKEWKDEKLRHRGDRYEDLKDIFGRKLWQQCIELYPQLDGKKVYMEVGTPVTNQYYLACPQGEMYGLDQRVSRFSAEVTSTLRSDTDIKGLYLTGQDTFSCGFTPAVLSGLFCASKILNRNIYMDLLKLRKQINGTSSIISGLSGASSITNGISHKKKE